MGYFTYQLVSRISSINSIIQWTSKIATKSSTKFWQKVAAQQKKLLLLKRPSAHKPNWIAITMPSLKRDHAKRTWIIRTNHQYSGDMLLFLDSRFISKGKPCLPSTNFFSNFQGCIIKKSTFWTQKWRWMEDEFPFSIGQIFGEPCYLGR